MDAEQVGIYLLLLLEQWQQGPIPDGSEDELADVMRTHSDRIAKVLRNCFEKTPKGWVNPRLLRIEGEQKAKSEGARKAAKARWDKVADANALRTHYERNANQNQNQNQSTDKGSKKKRAVRLPDSWKPTDSHAERASGSGLNLSREAEKFRLHANEKGRTAKCWNSAFTRWLINADEYATANGTKPKKTTNDWLADL